jgi:hypothetical protein
MASSGMLCHVAHVKTNISEELSAFMENPDLYVSVKKGMFQASFGVSADIFVHNCINN